MDADRLNTTKVQTLKAEFKILNMKETEAIDDFAMKINGIVGKFWAFEDTMDNAYIMKNLFRFVPGKFVQITSTIASVCGS